jgi:futalosine hydrolase
MYIVLCTATDFEIQPTIDFIKEKDLKGVEVLITGVGMTAATYHITRAILTGKPDLVIQAGIAGCFDEDFQLSQVVAVKSEAIGDLGVNENGKFNSLFDMNFLNENHLPWKNRKLVNESPVLEQSSLETVDAVTINEITTTKEMVAYYKSELSAQIESMEGAALHYVCLQENVSFLQIRSLSNFVGERDKNKWQLKEAIASLNSELQRIILKFLNQ